MVFLIILFMLVVVFRWFFKDNNEWYTEMYIGKKGCGKTATIAKYALSFSKKGYKVYTNVDSISNAYYFNPKELDKYKPMPNSILLIDEVGLIWDNRDFKEFKANEFFKYARQYRCKVILFSQAFDIDLKIRNLVDQMYLMTRIGKIAIYRPVNKKLGIVQRSDGTGGLEDTYVYGPIWQYKFTWLPRYYGLFVSHNPPKRSLVSSVLTKCSEAYLQYDSFKNWALFVSKRYLTEWKQILGKISEKIFPFILRSKIKYLFSSSTGRAKAATISLKKKLQSYSQYNLESVPLEDLRILDIV